MAEVTCIDEANYSHALTRGKRYTLVASDEREQIRIRGDNNRIRWYPGHIFDFENRPVPMLQSYTIDDPLEVDRFIDVTVTFTTGERRYCTFVTPPALANSGHPLENGNRFHYELRTTIIVNHITVEAIEQILHYMDSQNDLIECTLLLKYEPE